jgi:hypothetical protein
MNEAFHLSATLLVSVERTGRRLSVPPAEATLIVVVRYRRSQFIAINRCVPILPSLLHSRHT